jgi:hypothetical protein
VKLLWGSLTAVLVWGGCLSPVFAVDAPGASEAPETVEAEAPPPQANGQVLFIVRGKRAPWDGMLIEQKDLVRWKLNIENLQFKLDRDVKLEKDSCNLRIDFFEKSLKLEQDRTGFHDKMWKDKVEDLAEDVVAARKDAVEARKRGFFEQPVFWVVVGAAITGTTFGLGLALAN